MQVGHTLLVRCLLENCRQLEAIVDRCQPQLPVKVNAPVSRRTHSSLPSHTQGHARHAMSHDSKWGMLCPTFKPQTYCNDTPPKRMLLYSFHIDDYWTDAPNTAIVDLFKE